MLHKYRTIELGGTELCGEAENSAHFTRLSSLALRSEETRGSSESLGSWANNSVKHI
jgi:hypothetical protein